MDIVQALQSVGLEASRIEADDQDVDALVAVGDGGQTWTLAIEARRRAPYPNEVDRLAPRRRRLEALGAPLLFAPFITEGTGESLTDAGWSWADNEGNVHIQAPGLWVHRRLPTRARRNKTRTIPQGAGSMGIIRSLLGFDPNEAEPLTTTTLTQKVGVSQPRVTQVLGRLRHLGLIAKEGRHWWPDREALLDRFLSEYRGPGGSERFFYSLAEPSDVAVALTRHCAPLSPVLVSADVGPDLYAPWLRPRIVILYSRADVPIDDTGLVEAIGPADANVIVRHPLDTSVFDHATVGAFGNAELPLVDVPQMIWDLEDLGGNDRIEAAGELRQWLLNR